MKKIIILLITLFITILLSIWIFNIPAYDNYSYDPIIITPKQDIVPEKINEIPNIIDETINNSIVFCIDNSKAIVNNKLIDIDKNTTLKPIKQNEIFVPLEFLLKNLNIQYKIQTDGSIIINNKTIDNSKIYVDSLILYISTANINELLGQNCFIYDDLIIISKEKISYNSKIIENFKTKFNKQKEVS